MNSLQKAEYKILKYYDEFAKSHNLDYILYAGTMLGAVRHQGFIPWDDDIDVAMKRDEFEKFEELFIKSNYKKEGYTYQTRKVYPFQALPFSKIRSSDLNIIERTPKTQKGNLGPWIDIFPIDNIPDDPQKRLEQYKKVSFYNEVIKKFLLIQVEPEDTGIKKMIKGWVQWLNEKLHPLYFFMPYLFRKRDEYMTMYNDIETLESADLSYIYYKDFEDYSQFVFRNRDFKELTEVKFEEDFYKIPKNYDEILTKNYGDYMTLPKESERKVHKIIYSKED